jgi:methyl-accepting chemotaxis protein
MAILWKGAIAGLLGGKGAGGLRPSAFAGMTEVAGDLERLAGETEHDFLRVGAQLGGILESARSISSQMSEFADGIAGEHGDRVVSMLREVLEVASGVKASADSGSEALHLIRESSQRIVRIMAELGGILPTYRVLGILVRIETSRLAGSATDFGSMSDDVQNLTERTNERVDGVLAASERMRERVGGALGELAKAQSRQIGTVPAVISDALRNLDSYQARQQCAQQRVAQLAVQFEAVSKATVELVAQLQFHDITRQQVEHVAQSLREICRGPRPKDARAAVLLQASQLSSAAESFARSVHQIESSLEGIGTEIGRMTAAQGLSGESGEGEGRVFEDMESSLTVILSRLEDCLRLRAAVQESARDLGTVIEEIQTAAGGIDSIDIEMQRMALNAAIRATHLGQAGDPLGVLAENIRQLSLQCSGHGDAVCAQLERMPAALEVLGAGPGSQMERYRFSTKAMMEAVHQMHTVNEQAFSRLCRIEDHGSRLVNQVAALRSEFTAGRLFQEVAGAAGARLHEVAGTLDANRDEQAGTGMDELAQRYTMQAERDVHHASTGAGAPAAPDPAPAETAPAAEFGENVELF